MEFGEQLKMSSKILILFLCFFTLLKATEQDFGEVNFDRINQELLRLKEKYPQKNCHSARVPLFEKDILVCWLKAVVNREAHYKQWIIGYWTVWEHK